ncbi:MAG: hypothetical protein ACYDEF_15970 [Methanosarcina sp.]
MSRFPSSTEKPVIGSCQLYAGHRLVSKQGIFQTYFRLVARPDFDDIIKPFDTSTPVQFHSAP